MLLLSCVFTAPEAEAAGAQPKSGYRFAGADWALIAVDGEGTPRPLIGGLSGLEWFQESLQGWSDIQAISTNGYVVAGLKRDGTVVSNLEEQRQELAGWQNVTQIVTAYDHVIGLRQDGTVLSVGSDWDSWQAEEDPSCRDGHYDFSSWSDVKKLVCKGYEGGTVVIGLRRDGTLVDSLDTYTGQLYSREWSGPAERVKDVVSNGWLDVALKEDGSVICRGVNDSVLAARTADWRGVVQIAILYLNAIIGLMPDGTVRMAIAPPDWWGGPDEWYAALSEAVKPEKGWRDIVALRSSREYLVGLRKDGTAVAWCGNNFVSQDEGDACLAEIQSWKDLEDVVVLDTYVAGLRKDGTAIVWVGDRLDECLAEVQRWKGEDGVQASDICVVGRRRGDSSVISSLDPAALP